MHPLVKRATIEATRGFSPRYLKRLREELLSLAGEPLRDAVRALIFLGLVLEEDDREESARELFLLVESVEVIAALDAANASRVAEDGERVASGAKKFARFAGGPRSVRSMVKDGSSKPDALGSRRFAGLRLR